MQINVDIIMKSYPVHVALYVQLKWWNSVKFQCDKIQN